MSKKPFYIILCFCLVGVGFLIGNTVFSFLIPSEEITKPQQPLSSVSMPIVTSPSSAVIVNATPAIPANVNDIKINTDKRVILPAFVLKGIVFAQGNSVALVNNHLVKVGDTILGAKVADITENTVELIFENQKITLRIGQ